MANASIPTNVQQAREAVVNSDLYAMCYLMLATYAYAGQSKAATAVASINATFQNNMAKAAQTVPANTPVPNCFWKIVWGPNASDDNSNLAYAAALMDPASNLPIMGAIAIRGTDVEANKCPGLFEQILQDVRVKKQKPWPYTMPKTYENVLLAAGTLNGLQNKILKLGTTFLDKKGSIANWVVSFAATYPGTPIVVTGHSLGGCQTTALAAYLRSKESGVPASVQICPNPFAGPTAGNTGFAAMYDDLFGATGRRWFNTFDVAPMAFNQADVASLAQFWNSGQWACVVEPGATPLVMSGHWKTAYNVIQNWVANKGYQQPATTTATGARPLNGQCSYPPPSASFPPPQLTSSDPFTAMVLLQHFPPAYQAMMVSQGYAQVIWPPATTVSV